MRRLGMWLGIVLGCAGVVPTARAAASGPLPISAHNCYLANQADNPRLDEALELGIDNIEIDLGWDAATRRLIVGHDAAPRPGVTYPEFESMLVPALQRHGRSPSKAPAPTVLTIDWKTDRPEAVAAFQAVLDRHADWFSSAPKQAESPLTVRRLTVCLTGGDAAKEAYDRLIPEGGTYRAFRDTVTGNGAPFQADVSALIPRPATAYHRFLTWHWSVVERGGPFAAASWSTDDAKRLGALVHRAHDQGYRVRVYCLNGHTSIPLSGYRFRSDADARVRWLAAARAGVDWIASDEYAAIVAALRAEPAARPESFPLQPARRVVDLDVGESARVTLANGAAVNVTLKAVAAATDPIRGAVRGGTIDVVIDGRPVSLGTGNYERPVTVGPVQVDCPIIAAYRGNTTEDHWGLVKAARLRFWPAGAPWIDAATFRYPARQAWFASMTQMANEPVYVDGGEEPSRKKVYYHSGLDIGGAEGLTPVVAATDGLVVSSGLDRLPGLEDSPIAPRYDVVYLRDNRGWYYRYSHLATIDPALRPGAAVRMGQPVGLLGKEGGSGGWTHLHFEIKSRQPSGLWGTEEGYAYLWQVALAEQARAVVAVARPHRFAWVGDPVRLDAGKSWSRDGQRLRYRWQLSDGTVADTATVEHTYNTPGSYSEVLRVETADGQVDHDFAVVQVVDPARPDRLPPTIHASYFPSMGLKPGDPVTFKVRTFRVGRDGGHETWDFGDGTPPVAVVSDGNAEQHAPEGYAAVLHRFEKPGTYLVRVERADRDGLKATARLGVRVGPP